MRYWVGIDSDWHSAANWSASSGGPGGAGVPTSADDVVIDGGGYVLCWALAPIECAHFSILAGATEMNMFNQGGIVYGDFNMAAGYFAPTGGGGHTLEFKGNWISTGGTFAVGTGGGVDPTVEFSGTGKTYQLNQLSSANFQHLLISGSLTVSGTRLGQMNISQLINVTGTLTINALSTTTICDVDLDGVNAGFGTFTGTINGTGRMWYRYRAGSTMIPGGTISVKYWRYYLTESTALIPGRAYGDTTTVEIDYNSDGQVCSLAGRQTVLGKLRILCDETAVYTAELDCTDAELWIEGNFEVDTNAFINATWTWRLGDNTHVFKAAIKLYYSYSSASSHLVVDAGEGTILLWPAKGTGGMIIFITHRLGRAYAGGYERQTYNRVILYSERDNLRGARFTEGFACADLHVEAYGGNWQFLRQTATPQMIFECDRLTVIGDESRLPQLSAARSLTPAPFALQVNERAEVFAVRLRNVDASHGVAIDAYNSTPYLTTTNVSFYNRDVRSIPRQRNVLADRPQLTPTPAPEPLVPQILEAMG